MRILIILLAIILISFIGLMIVDIVLIGFLHPRYYKKQNGKVMIEHENRLEFQHGNECSGFSSACVIRHFGIAAEAMDVYQDMPFKMKNGYVYPKAIPKLLLRYDIKTTYCRGNINSLRHEIGKGNPVIVLIRYDTKHNWLHYVAVVGIDEEKVYIVESLEDLVNEQNDKRYNRSVRIEDFKQLWNTSMVYMPFYRNTFFSFRK